jgi:hypothetical protein
MQLVRDAKDTIESQIITGILDIKIVYINDVVNGIKDYIDVKFNAAIDAFKNFIKKIKEFHTNDTLNIIVSTE